MLLGNDDGQSWDSGKDCVIRDALLISARGAAKSGDTINSVRGIRVESGDRGIGDTILISLGNPGTGIRGHQTHFIGSGRQSYRLNH